MIVAAHPRSRGENRSAISDIRFSLGSSPLTRGKPAQPTRRRVRSRLIPAHAGKTALDFNPNHTLGAHPRSRGENPFERARYARSMGSSPLTRGKLSRVITCDSHKRLIPAHAGKTAWPADVRVASWAHPRSRGENASSMPRAREIPGSSPLTRGKHVAAPARSTCAGLIPAHAGKTTRPMQPPCRREAHPRSRGENEQYRHASSEGVGSSPLTRGKLSSLP